MGTNVRDNLNLPLPPGATPLTPEEIEGLIPRHVTTRKELYDADNFDLQPLENLHRRYLSKFS